ncbi:PH domain-containing protein [Actinomadura sp. DSM 109109]|nr:PH domain-containing protein [Actinomadura lepetitiana]
MTSWQRPHPLSIAAGLAGLLGPLAALGGAALLGSGLLIPLGSLTVTAVTVAAVVTARRATTRYRISGEALEVRSGLAFRRRRTVPLDRVRTVDVTADPVHRLLGLAALTVGTAEAGRVALPGLARAEARDLRARLLERARPGETVATLDPRWIRYAPLTLWVIGGVGIAVGTAFRVIDAMGLEPQDVALLRDGFAWLTGLPLPLAAALAVAAVLGAGTLGATAVYLENWWRFTLQRDGSGTFTVLRGLLTTRSVTVPRDRIRGAQLTEPLLQRLAGGARANVIAVGLASHEDASTCAKTVLLPPAPRQHAVAVVHGTTGLPLDDVVWTPHPRAALRRRVGRALWCVLPPLAALAASGIRYPPLAVLAGCLALVAVPAALALAVDAYRSLGHAICDGHLLARSGTFARRTVALDQGAVIGWTFTRSPFQRRHGLATLGATTAAGKHIYRLHDLPLETALTLTTELTTPALPAIVHPQDHSETTSHPRAAAICSARSASVEAPDASRRDGAKPTHFHCYRWSAGGQEWERLGRADTLDAASPDRPPVRTVDWLIKSARFVAAVHTDPKDARDWLIREWDQARGNALNPVPEWVRSQDRAERALRAIETACWPTYSQWLAGGVIILWSVVGTPERCH